MGGDYVTLNQLVTAFNRTGSYSYKMISWVENRGLPVHNKRVQQNTFRVVYLKEFWTWAEKNRSFLDFSKLEPLAFGEEPAWVAEQRKRDFKACSLQRKDPWTPAEDAKLRMLLEQYKYTYEQMSDMLRRSPGAIQRRCADLGLKARPVRINPHGPEAVWHQEDYDRLAEGIKSGESYMSISKALGKSEKAIRGKVYYCYLTENADKVRTMMAGGNWGDGAPEPTVWQARLLSRSRAEMQTTMTMLVEALNCRIRQVGYDPALEDHWNQYWQRTTCLHWDDLKHCTAGCTDCDSCAEYKKIPPQYCARCGATFYERKENTFCLQCRFDRKKQAQRHWCRVNAKTRKKTVKRKHDLLKEKSKTRDAVGQISSWCLLIALHQRFGVGADRMERIAGEAEKLQKEIAAIIDGHGTAAGIAEMQRRLDGICLTEMRVPLNRNTKNRREVELRMAADQTVTAMWCCFALAIHQTLGFGRDRLNRLHKETVENYRQFNEWNGSGSRDEQQYAFERLRHCAEQALRSEVVIVQENDDYDSRVRLWERQLEDSIKAGVHKAKVETKRKACVNALATNVLSDAARQQAALKVQQDFFGGGYR